MTECHWLLPKYKSKFTKKVSQRCDGWCHPCCEDQQVGPDKRTDATVYWCPQEALGTGFGVWRGRATISSDTDSFCRAFILVVSKLLEAWLVGHVSRSGHQPHALALPHNPSPGNYNGRRWPNSWSCLPTSTRNAPCATVGLGFCHHTKPLKMQVLNSNCA